MAGVMPEHRAAGLGVPVRNGKTPLRQGNIWRRHIGPRLRTAGLGWITFQVLRRSCSSMLSDLGVEGKVVADQLGHTLDVNQNVYRALHSIGRRKQLIGWIQRCV